MFSMSASESRERIAKYFTNFQWFSDSKWDRVQLECIKCLKAIMNNKIFLYKHKSANLRRKESKNELNIVIYLVKMVKSKQR